MAMPFGHKFFDLGQFFRWKSDHDGTCVDKKAQFDSLEGTAGLKELV